MSGALKATSTVRELVDAWKRELSKDNTVAPNTAHRYFTMADSLFVLPYGSLRVVDARRPILDAFANDQIAPGMATTTRHARGVLKKFLAVAVEHNILEYNFAIEIKVEQKPEPNSVPDAGLDDLLGVLVAIIEWESRPHAGPQTPKRLSDIFTILLGTGSRIGEVLALRWEDIDFEATPRPTMRIDGTLDLGTPGQVIRRKPIRSIAGSRVVQLPDFVVEVFRRRKAEHGPNPLDAVFATYNGTWVSPNNVRRSWRQIRTECGYEWVTPYAFRKTVAAIVMDHFRLNEPKGGLTQLGYVQHPFSVDETLSIDGWVSAVDKFEHELRAARKRFG